MRTLIAVILVALLSTSVIADTSEIFKATTTSNSQTLSGTKWIPISTDTTKVNSFVITVIGAFSGTVSIQTKAYGVKSGLGRIDSFATTRGTVRRVSGITNDSLMRIWFPALTAPGDTTNNPALSLLKQTSNLFSYTPVVKTLSSGNGGAVFISVE